MNRKDLTNLIALGEGFTTEFKQGGINSIGSDTGSTPPPFLTGMGGG